MHQEITKWGEDHRVTTHKVVLRVKKAPRVMLSSTMKDIRQALILFSFLPHGVDVVSSPLPDSFVRQLESEPDGDGGRPMKSMNPTARRSFSCSSMSSSSILAAFFFIKMRQSTQSLAGTPVAFCRENEVHCTIKQKKPTAQTRICLLACLLPCLHEWPSSLDNTRALSSQSSTRLGPFLGRKPRISSSRRPDCAWRLRLPGPCRWPSSIRSWWPDSTACHSGT